MKMAGAMTVSEWKLLVREPSAFFFTLVFPILLVLVFGSIFGNDPADGYNGRGSVDLSVPAYCVLIIGTLAIFNIPIALASKRETGVLQRLRATPIRSWMVFASQLVVGFAVTAAGTILMLIIGRILFDLRMPEQPFATAVALILGVISFGTVGFLLAAVVTTSRQAQVIANLLYFPQLFLSGVSIPRELFPDWLRSISEWLPLTQLVLQVQSLWFGEGWRTTSLIYMAVLFAVGAVVSVRLFRWEK